MPRYIGAQVLGATAAAVLVLLVAVGQPVGYDPQVSGLAANGFGDHSPGGFSLLSGLVIEVLGERKRATVLVDSPFDPDNLHLKA